MDIPSSLRLWRPVIDFIAAAFGGALLVALALWLFYRSGDPLVAPTLVLTGADLHLTAGAGKQTADGVVIRQVEGNGVVIVQGAIQPLEAEQYRRLAWHVEGLKPGQDLRAIWATADNPQAIREQPLSFDHNGEGRLDLSGESHWTGRIVAMGLVIKGAIQEPLRVSSLELHPQVLSPSVLLHALVDNWTHTEGWTGRSINFDYGGPRDARFRPVIVTALWVILASLLYALLNPTWRGHKSLAPYAALCLIGWLALDLRWQWVLGQRLIQTQERYAGLDGEARQLAGPDRHLYPFMREVRRHLPAEPARIFILSDDPNGYVSGRARYHLLPHNTYAGLSGLPDAKQAHPGDYVLALEPLPGLDYDRERHLLSLKAAQWPADLVYAGSGRGALFLLRRGF